MWTCIKCNAVNEDTYTICPKCGAATRVSISRETGKRVRVCKKCGKPID